jgi:hypothetical protein
MRPTAIPRLGVPGRPVPELAGVCTYAEFAHPGVGVEANVALLKRYNWVESRLTDLFLTRLNSTPEWEVKGAFSLHVWLDAEHAKWLRERVAQLRHPPHRFEQVPSPALEAWLQEALRSRGTIELLIAIYRSIKPALLGAYRTHMELTHPLMDQPTRRTLRFIILEETEMIEWGEQALSALLAAATDQQRAAADAWDRHLRAFLSAAGGVAGDSPRLEAELPSARAAEEPEVEVDWTPQRDDRIESDNYNFPPHWVYAQRNRPVEERMLALICKRLLEMDVPETLASIVYRSREASSKEGKARPWSYTADMCRQLWDEARHSMLGEGWLAARGIDWTQVPLNRGFSLALNTQVTPREAHAALYWIEQGLMPRQTGKGYEYDTSVGSGDALAALIQDYDWADEVLHVYLGRHIVEELGSRKDADRLGEEVFHRVMERRRHETEGMEWWTQFCERTIGLTPAPLDEAEQATDAPWKNG